MSTKKSQERKTLTQEEIDRQVVADANTEDAWDEPVRVSVELEEVAFAEAKRDLAGRSSL